MRSEDGNGGMDNGDIEGGGGGGGGDDQFHARRGRRYTPVVDDDDRAVLEMASMDPSGSSSSSLSVHQASLKYLSLSFAFCCVYMRVHFFFSLVFVSTNAWDFGFPGMRGLMCLSCSFCLFPAKKLWVTKELTLFVCAFFFG